MIIYEQDSSPTTWVNWLGLIDGTLRAIDVQADDAFRQRFRLIFIVEKDDEHYANVFKSVPWYFLTDFDTKSWLGAKVTDAVIENGVVTVTFDGDKRLQIMS